MRECYTVIMNKTTKINSMLFMFGHHDYCRVNCNCSCHYVDVLPDYASMNLINALSKIGYECWYAGESLPSLNVVSNIVRDAVNVAGQDCSPDVIEITTQYIFDSIAAGSWSQRGLVEALEGFSCLES